MLQLLPALRRTVACTNGVHGVNIECWRTAEADQRVIEHEGRRNEALLPRAYRALDDALHLARSLGDLRAESAALGHLGTLYRADGQPRGALEFTRQAVAAAQRAGGPDLLYRW